MGRGHSDRTKRVRALGLEDSSWNSVLPEINQSTNQFLSLPHVGTQQEDGPLGRQQAGGGFSSEPKHAGTLTLDCQPLEL